MLSFESELFRAYDSLQMRRALFLDKENCARTKNYPYALSHASIDTNAFIIWQFPLTKIIYTISETLLRHFVIDRHKIPHLQKVSQSS